MKDHNEINNIKDLNVSKAIVFRKLILLSILVGFCFSTIYDFYLHNKFLETYTVVDIYRILRFGTILTLILMAILFFIFLYWYKCPNCKKSFSCFPKTRSIINTYNIKKKLYVTEVLLNIINFLVEYHCNNCNFKKFKNYVSRNIIKKNENE